ncbi:MAG: hypothetical protein JWR14_5204, partial [Caballeronia sp.]|nr:hypothetical protein [Caballeronia sp.]
MGTLARGRGIKRKLETLGSANVEFLESKSI